MSSAAVRLAIKNFLATEFPGETVIDLSGEADQIEQLLAVHGVTKDQPWLGLQFAADDEEIVSLAASPSEGCFREYGAIFLHCADIAQLGGGKTDSMVARADAIRSKLRARRFGSIVVTTVTPPNTESGAALLFDSGYMCATFIADYYMDINP